MKNKIKLLNKIASCGTDVFDKDRYEIGEDITDPDAIMVRSAVMHDMELGANLKAVARAGAGVNNIPLEKCAENGIVVFNTPGANANGVKELVICGMLLACRDVVGGIEWVKTIAGDENTAKLVEKGKSAFAGTELAGKTLGIIGLGAIGANVANAALSLGMDVYGYDPFLSVHSALQLSRAVNVVKSLDDIYKNCDYITIHIPYIPEENKGFINAGVIRRMKDGAVLINLARGELVNNADVVKATENGKLYRYVTDFPAEELIGAKNVICTPHLGASTEEAEENCAAMAARELIEYIENGNITNSVNYPNCSMPRTGACRLVVLHKNANNLLAQITAAVASEGVNIANLTNQSRGDYAVTIIDADSLVSEDAVCRISEIKDVIRVRTII